MTGLAWEIVSDFDPFDPKVLRQSVAEAWRSWAIASCEERHGGHLWIAALEPWYDAQAAGTDDDPGYGSVDISCEGCPAGIHDIYPDGWECLYGEVAGLTINGGRHESLMEITAPVTVELRVERYPATPDHGEEYDIWIEVEERG